jgi:tRNA(adenine34) deaminase
MDEYYMYKALLEAEKALANDDVPVGCVIVHNDTIIARAYNQIEKKKDSTAHAELTAIKKATKKIGYKHLLDCTMYVTLEPCAMCAGAIVLARIPRLVIGTKDPKTGACGSVLNITNEKRLNHRCDVRFGVLEEKCSYILKDFFKKLRKTNK